MKKEYCLKNNWKLRLLNNNSNEVPLTHDVEIDAIVPGVVHTDLLRNGIIEDPFYSDNELKLRWVDECDWLYYCKFDAPEDFDIKKNIKLLFKGVDTIASIKLNKVVIGQTDNMFLAYELNVNEHLREKNNLLELEFYSAKRYARAEEKKYGRLPVPLDAERVYIRKAQYSFGWDWGPSFPTMGLWKNVYLVQEEDVKITDVAFNTVTANDDKAAVKINFCIEGKSRKGLSAKVVLSIGENIIIRNYDVSTSQKIEDTIEINNPLLWRPNGMGESNLYDFNISVVDSKGNELADSSQKVGIRTIDLQLKDGDKETFRFVINGKPIFAKGVNWIPGDAFLPRVTKEKYERLLNYAKDASMNIVRVWGGGIYENEEFYDLCDELGLLVWQDFMFACGSYPEHDEIITNIEKEVNYNVRRLRNHASIALWCGNNENEWIWGFSQKSNYSEMPGYAIYHKLIPGIVKELDPARAYWLSSPFGFDDDPNSQTSGNRHQWEIWSHWVDYNEVINDNSLFVTEFGFQGPANLETFKKYIPSQNQKIHDKIFEHHNKQVEGPERVIKFLSAHLPLPKTFEDFIYLAQLNQGFALKTCLEHWRYNNKTNGSIIWQINDTWPVTSWALIDSELKPKLAYHFVKSVFQSVQACFKQDGSNVNLFLLSELNSFEGRIAVQSFDTRSGLEIINNQENVKLAAGELKTFRAFDLADILKEESTILISTLYNKEGRRIHRNYFTPMKWKHLKMIDAKLDINICEKHLVISTDTPAYFVDLYYPEVVFSERGLILLPGEEISIEFNEGITQLKSDDLQIYHLNKYLKEE